MHKILEMLVMELKKLNENLAKIAENTTPVPEPEPDPEPEPEEGGGGEGGDEILLPTE